MELLDRQKRYVDVLTLLAKHDMAWLLERAGVVHFVPAEFRRPAESTVPLTQPERVRRLCEELGPTFVKMGQICSTRPDLVPHAYLVELKKLQDHVTPLSFETVRTVVESEFGKPLGEVFAEFDEEHLAAASIGQVHRVVLKDGTRAVVKVQRPGTEATIRQDLAILRSLAHLANQTKALGPLDAVAMLTEFERSLLRELDYMVEGRATDEFRAQHAADPEIVVPRVFWETTTQRVLTLEFVDGVKVSAVERLREGNHDLARIAQKLVDVVLAQVFQYGRFHADPHPGNLMVMPDGRLALIDFGMCGRFDDPTRRAIIDLMRDLGERDHHRLPQTLLTHGLVDYDADLRQIRTDAREMFRSMAGGASMQDQMQLFFGMVVRHHIAFPPDLFFLDKVFGTLDGAVKTLNPKMSMTELATGFFTKLATGANDVKGILTRLLSRIVEADSMLVDLPSELLRVTRRLDSGHLKMQNVWTPSEGAIRAASRLATQAGLLVLGTVIIGAVLASGTPDVSRVGELATGGGLFGVGALWLLLSK
jgi:ubiquinone biosynthesis protein